MNPRLWSFWDNDFLGALREAVRTGDYGLVPLSILMYTMTFIMILGLPVFGIFEFFSLPFSGLAFTLAVVIPVSLTYWMPTIYLGHSMPTSVIRVSVKRYLSLSKEDQRLYPKGILDTLRDPDVDSGDKYNLEMSMDRIYRSIQERDRQKRLLDKRHVDVSHLIQYMEDAKRGVDIEINTYKEFT